MLFRSIQDNILAAHEIFHSFHTNKRKRVNRRWMALKIDMEKAYDKIDWNFIYDVMRKFGFSEKWITIIQQCLETCSLSILVNNQPGQEFNPSCGIRQGDPIAPFIFIIAMEFLTRKLTSISQQPSKNIGIQLTKNGMTIPMLSFADDTIIFAKAKTENALFIKNLLQEFGQVSGLQINYNKSSLQVSSNVPATVINQLTQILGVKSTTCLEKYLGIPLVKGRIRREVFNDLLNSI